MEIKERRRMDKLLLKAIRETSLDGILIVDKDDRVISFNQRFSDIWGISDDIMAKQSGEEALEHVLPLLKNPEDFKQRINNLYRNREEKSQEDIVLKDGRTLDRYSSPILNGEGEYYGRIWFYRDITERRQAQKDLMKEKERFKNIIDSAPFGYYRIGKNRLWEHVNTEWERMHSLKAEDVIGKSFEVTQPADKVNEARENVEKVFAGEILRGEASRIGPDGKTEYHTFNIQPVEDNGEVVAIEGFINDITERKRKEERVRYLNSHDALTGLSSRAFTEKALIKKDKKENYPISIIVIDVNGLKVINDTYGHLIGDKILKNCGDIIVECSRKEDVAGRWGGDEFIIILPKTNRKEAEKVCKRIVETKGYVENIPISMAAGIGVREKEEQSFQDIFKRAEDEMYQRKLSEKGSSSYGIIDALLGALSQKSYETREHTYRMQKIAEQIAVRLEISEKERDNLNLAILMHDIGKINISEEILTKKESLDAKEWGVIKQHPIKGYQIALSTTIFAHIAEVVYSHHERWDGNGYPRGLKGKNIPFLSRIVTVVDAYDVMKNGRPYKKEMSKDQIIEDFKKNAGKQFDPDVVDVFLSILSVQP